MLQPSTSYSCYPRRLPWSRPSRRGKNQRSSHPPNTDILPTPYYSSVRKHMQNRCREEWRKMASASALQSSTTNVNGWLNPLLPKLHKQPALHSFYLKLTHNYNVLPSGELLAEHRNRPEPITCLSNPPKPPALRLYSQAPPRQLRLQNVNGKTRSTTHYTCQGLPHAQQLRTWQRHNSRRVQPNS